MAQLRFEALKKLNERAPVHVELSTPFVSKFFGENVYGMEQMRGTLSPAVFKKVSNSIKNHEKIDEIAADRVRSIRREARVPCATQTCVRQLGGSGKFALRFSRKWLTPST